jgi:DNA-binding transcriptional MerR regulator
MAAPPTNDQRYTCRDLATLTGLSERTVRYYLGEGLLPPPLARGRGPNFDDSHLVRLRLIKAMQEAGNDLSSIGAYLKELEAELAARGASFESALAVWSGRGERAALRERWTRRFGVPEALMRYRLAEGVELLVEPDAALSPERMQRLLATLTAAFEEEDK